MPTVSVTLTVPARHQPLFEFLPLVRATAAKAFASLGPAEREDRAPVSLRACRTGPNTSPRTRTTVSISGPTCGTGVSAAMVAAMVGVMAASGRATGRIDWDVGGVIAIGCVAVIAAGLPAYRLGPRPNPR